MTLGNAQTWAHFHPRGGFTFSENFAVLRQTATNKCLANVIVLVSSVYLYSIRVYARKCSHDDFILYVQVGANSCP